MKSGLGIARMTGSVMAGVDTEEKLEREDKSIIVLSCLLFLLQIEKGHVDKFLSFLSLLISGRLSRGRSLDESVRQ